MTKKRSRAKQTITLEERLSKYTRDLRQRQKALNANSEEAMRLRKRISEGEAALRLNASLNASR